MAYTFIPKSARIVIAGIALTISLAACQNGGGGSNWASDMDPQTRAALIGSLMSRPVYQATPYQGTAYQMPIPQSHSFTCSYVGTQTFCN